MKPTTATIELPQKIIDNFAITEQEGVRVRNRVFFGGRGGAKTEGVAAIVLARVYQWAELGIMGQFLCSREHLNSLDESSLKTLKGVINRHDWMREYYEVGEKYIRTKNGRISFTFAGLRHNIEGVLSKSALLGNWTDEAERVPARSWLKLIPTIRGTISDYDIFPENIITYNPESEESATHKMFVANPAPDTVITEINWRDNPWFPEHLDQDRRMDLKYRPDTYEHVWEGKFLTRSDSIVFSGKSEVKEFDVSDDWAGPYQGLDFGYAQDPTAAIRCYIDTSTNPHTLYIRHEANKVKLEIDETADFLNDCIPGFSKYTTRADSARPEIINHLKRKGHPKMVAVKKGPGSIEDGIATIRNFAKVVIHPECAETAREFRVYSYKVDRITGDVLPVIVDRDNHHIDALRYALEPIRKIRTKRLIRTPV